MDGQTESTRPAFETFFRVRFHEVDVLGHVNNASYLNYIEQAAIDHATFLGVDLDRLRQAGGVFVAHRHEIVFHRPTFAGDLLRVVTWLDDPVGARVTRHYRIFCERAMPAAAVVTMRAIAHARNDTEERPVVTAETEWVFTGASGRPRRMPPDIVDLLRPMETEPDRPDLPMG